MSVPGVLLRRTTRHLGRSAFCESAWVLLALGWLVLRSVAVDAAVVANADDNDFAEFEDDESETVVLPAEASVDEPPPPPPPPLAADDDDDDDEDALVQPIEDEDETEDEFAFLEDEEEFENFDRDQRSEKAAPRQAESLQPLRYADVPAHLRNNWANYQVELLMLVGLCAYLLNYAYGKTKNQALAQAWLDEHRDLLEQQFHVVGDDGTSDEPRRDHLIRDTDSTASLWCSGRLGCVGMLVQLRLLKRQDLVSVISQMMRPKHDKVHIRIELEPNEMDPFVFAVGQKKTLSKLSKELLDMSQYCVERKNADKLGLPASFAVYSELAEVVGAMLEPRMVAMLNKYEDFIDYVHISDQFCGNKAQDGEAQSKLPETSRVLVFSLNMPGKLATSERQVADAKPLLQLVFHCLEKMRRYRLTREGKVKAERNRQTAQESFLKTTHQQRQEAAQQRKEDKIRERKQRVLDEEDPDRQRRLEKQENKREAKRNQPKMKQLKIKSM